MTSPTPPRAVLVEQVAFLEALAVKAKAKADENRRLLAGQAADEYHQQGSAPTWRIKGLGTVVSNTARDAYEISDPAAFVTWVIENHPDEVTPVVRSSFQTTLLGNASVTEDGAVVSAGGQVLPGVRFLPGGRFKGISFRFDGDAKDAYAAVAGQALNRLHLEPEPLPVPAPASAGDAFLAAAAGPGPSSNAATAFMADTSAAAANPFLTASATAPDDLAARFLGVDSSTDADALAAWMSADTPS